MGWREGRWIPGRDLVVFFDNLSEIPTWLPLRFARLAGEGKKKGLPEAAP